MAKKWGVGMHPPPPPPPPGLKPLTTVLDHAWLGISVAWELAFSAVVKWIMVHVMLVSNIHYQYISFVKVMIS